MRFSNAFIITELRYLKKYTNFLLNVFCGSSVYF